MAIKTSLRNKWRRRLLHPLQGAIRVIPVKPAGEKLSVQDVALQPSCVRRVGVYGNALRNHDKFINLARFYSDVRALWPPAGTACQLSLRRLPCSAVHVVACIIKFIYHLLRRHNSGPMISVCYFSPTEPSVIKLVRVPPTASKYRASSCTL